MVVSIVLLDEVIDGSGDEIGLECVAVCKLHSNVCASSNHVLVQPHFFLVFIWICGLTIILFSLKRTLELTFPKINILI